MKVGNVRLYKPYVMKPNRCVHGPQVWPWWKLFGLHFVVLKPELPTTGYRLWIYVRKYCSINIDLYIDRRAK